MISKAAALFLGLLVWAWPVSVWAQPKVLVFSKTTGFRHDSIPDGIAAIQKLGANNNFAVDATEDAAIFSDAALAQYKAVIFLNTTGDILDANQKAAFQRYIRGGGGFAGIHSASDTEHNWAWYGGLVGAYFQNHPAIQTATVKVEDHAHPSTASLPDRWVRTDEWYNFSTNPRGSVRVLATLDETTYTGGTMGADHPTAWCHVYDGGRAWYTGGGHTKESYSEPLFLQHLLGGIQFAGGFCPGTINPTSRSFTNAVGAGSVSVTADAGCGWVVMSNNSWIGITSGNSGNGIGTVNFTVESNSGPARTGTITIANRTFTVIQGAPTASCSYTLSPEAGSFPASGGTGNALIQTAETCRWTAATQDSWITITSSTTGAGQEAIAYSVAPNPETFARTGTITVADKSLTITQATNCPFTLSLASQSFAADGGTGSVSVSGGNGCTWTAITRDDFISVLGSSNGTVTYSVAANTDFGRRTGTIIIAGQSFTVRQGAAFRDVPLSHPQYLEIGKLSARGITVGCGSGNFCPESSVTREQMAIFIERSLGQFNPPEPATQRFLDVPPARGGYAFINDFAARGITAGCGGGNFCPDQEVTRGPMAAFILRALGVFNPDPNVPQRFFDVPSSHPFYGFIDQLAARGITKGCGGGNYCPDVAVTRGQMAAFLVRAFGL